MTSHYADILLRGDEETPVHDVLGVVFGRLHAVLTRDRIASIGLSFPRYVSPGPHEAHHALGNVVRLHGTEQALAAILATDWLRNVHDHARVAPIADAPPPRSFVRWVRAQPKSNTERLVRRAMKRHQLTEVVV